MSLGKTLLKVAIGVAVVKGMSSLAKGGAAEAGPSGGLVPTGGQRPAGGQKPKGGLEDMMGDILGSGRTRGGGFAQDGGVSEGSGDLLDQVMRDTGGRGSVPKAGRATQAPAGRDAGLAPAPRATRQTAPKGGLEDLLGGAAGGGLGGLLESILAGGGQLAPQEREAELSAALALRAMIQAIKADGTLDAAEKRKLMDHLGEASRDEVAFVNAELQAPVDVQGLARQVPNGMEAQVYLASLMAIDLDNQEEAKYLAALAEALELRPAEVNALHDRAGAPRIFR